jgi:hypothetical protein
MRQSFEVTGCERVSHEGKGSLRTLKHRVNTHSFAQHNCRMLQQFRVPGVLSSQAESPSNRATHQTPANRSFSVNRLTIGSYETPPITVYRLQSGLDGGSDENAIVDVNSAARRDGKRARF